MHRQVFSQLATFQSALREDDLAMAAANRLNCFGTVASAPHAGLRQFPFLGQVRTHSSRNVAGHGRLLL